MPARENRDSTASAASTLFPAQYKLAVPLLIFAIVLIAILRPAVTTRFDSITGDENYHVVAGVSYFRTGDYRINPEHPPLVKLWVGAFIPESVLRLPPLQIFDDKSGERTYAAETVFLKNDPDRIQRHARFAMYCLNGSLLFVFALVARRVFGDVIALGALIFLAIDPTVAAHMPVVMTDLPVTLPCAITSRNPFRITSLKKYRGWGSPLCSQPFGEPATLCDNFRLPRSSESRLT